MTKEQALEAIKRLRDKINDEADCTVNAEMWENRIIEALDHASDLIEFGKQKRLYLKLTPFSRRLLDELDTPKTVLELIDELSLSKHYGPGGLTTSLQALVRRGLVTTTTVTEPEEGFRYVKAPTL